MITKKDGTNGAWTLRLLTVQRVEVDKAGKIIVVVGETDKTEPHAGANEWDRI